jgi:subtilisin family serine protease
MYITPYNDCETPTDFEALIEKIAHRLDMNASDRVPLTGCLQAWLKPQDLDIVARLDEVHSITEVSKYTTNLWTARGDANVFNMALTGIPATQYKAAGEIIGIADTGATVDHPAFQKTGTGGRSASRITAVSWRAASPGANTVNDTKSHGTHVAGCAAANWASPEVGPVAGPAPAAQLYV